MGGTKWLRLEEFMKPFFYHSLLLISIEMRCNLGALSYGQAFLN